MLLQRRECLLRLVAGRSLENAGNVVLNLGDGALTAVGELVDQRLILDNILERLPRAILIRKIAPLVRGADRESEQKQRKG